jgi:hypothetical protein
MGLTGPEAPAPARTQGIQIWSHKPRRRTWGEHRRTSRPQCRRAPGQQPRRPLRTVPSSATSPPLAKLAPLVTGPRPRDRRRPKHAKTPKYPRRRRTAAPPRPSTSTAPLLTPATRAAITKQGRGETPPAPAPAGFHPATPTGGGEEEEEGRGGSREGRRRVLLVTRGSS